MLGCCCVRKRTPRPALLLLLLLLRLRRRRPTATQPAATCTSNFLHHGMWWRHSLVWLCLGCTGGLAALPATPGGGLPVPGRQLLDDVGDSVVATWQQARAKARAALERARGAIPRSGLGARRGKEASLGVDVAALERLSWGLLRSDPQLWGSPAAESRGVTVWKRWLPKGEYGSENSMVKSVATVAASPAALFDLIFDSSRTREYNPFSVGRTDVAVVGKTTKIVWNRTAPPGAKKCDFCTLMHGLQFPNGTHVIMTTATEHPSAQPTAEFQRSHVLVGINLMEPVDGGTRLTVINHVKTAGVAPFLAEQVAARSAINFVQKVKAVFSGDEETEEDCPDGEACANPAPAALAAAT